MKNIIIENRLLFNKNYSIIIAVRFYKSYRITLFKEIKMSIQYNHEDKMFTLKTANTQYAFQILYDQFPIHCYYGQITDAGYGEHHSNARSFCPYYRNLGLNYSPDTEKSEYVGFDSGDFRATSLRVKNSSGDSVTVLKYKGYRIFDGRLELKGLPYASADENTQTLEIQMYDEVTSLDVKLYYTVFAKEDVISRYVSITNNSESDLLIEKCMSLLLDLPDHDYDMISLYGQHASERHYQRVPLHYGAQNVFSRRGASSHQLNPFIALCEKDATQETGRAFGFNFVYSGNFLDEVEVDQTGMTRVQVGLGSDNFKYLLTPGENFTSPEAVMTFSANGIGQMSRNFHDFTRNHILPAEIFANRPVVLNTWEACYFAIDEDVMLTFAETAAKSGIDMVVMDDGWFGARNHDRAGLGDWYENRDKFKNGLKAFVDNMKSYGIKFGIWIEPEMVNPDSELFRAHPEWCLQSEGREIMESRNQLVLDMGNPAVIQYLKDIFSKTFDGVAIDYFKWDMNRHLSNVTSPVLPKERKGESAYRHMLGVYELFAWFREKYPHAMIENCSGGGGRYDLGMMKYSTMIWTSDNTNPHDRIHIQYSSMLGYPASTMSCHVSNHGNIIETPKALKYRYEVALGGPIGYEFHLPSASDAVKNAVHKQIDDYHEKYEDLIIRGDYYSVINPFETNYSAYYYTNAEKDRILLSFLQNSPEEPKEILIPVSAADIDAVYVDEITGVEYTGEQLRNGVKAHSENDDMTSQIWYLVKK